MTEEQWLRVKQIDVDLALFRRRENNMQAMENHNQTCPEYKAGAHEEKMELRAKIDALKRERFALTGEKQSDDWESRDQ
jgi:hypothetical protein